MGYAYMVSAADSRKRMSVFRNRLRQQVTDPKLQQLMEARLALCEAVNHGSNGSSGGAGGDRGRSSRSAASTSNSNSDSASASLDYFPYQLNAFLQQLQ